MTKQEFIDKINPVSVQIETETKIKPIILIAQAAHESGWGCSELTQKANNLFGFTGESWQAKGKPVIIMPTGEFIKGKHVTVDRPFRKYDSWLESAQDWARLISTLDRYKIAYAYAQAGDIENYAVYVAKGGYATDPRYAEKLNAMGNYIRTNFKV